MKRERALQIAVLIVGLFYSVSGYILFDTLLGAKWIHNHNDVLPMFLTYNTALGVCLLFAVKHANRHRMLIAYGAWSSLAHAFTMIIMSAQAASQGMHRKDSPWDIVIFTVIGIALLAVLPAKQPSTAGTAL